MTEFEKHLTDEQVVDWIEANLSTSNDAEMQAHLTACRDCRRAVAGLRRVLDATKSNDLAEVPNYLKERVYGLIDEPTVVPSKSDSSDKKPFIAQLLFDRIMPLPVFRSEHEIDARQLRFATDQDCIDLEFVGAAEPNIHIHGTILSPSSVRSVRIADARGNEIDLKFDDHEFDYVTGSGSELRFTIELEGRTISFDCGT